MEQKGGGRVVQAGLELRHHLCSNIGSPGVDNKTRTHHLSVDAPQRTAISFLGLHLADSSRMWDFSAFLINRNPTILILAFLGTSVYAIASISPGNPD